MAGFLAPARMSRRALLGGMAGTLAVAPLVRTARAAALDIRLHTATGTIDGTLDAVAAAPAPLVLIVPGSGSIDRNGNSSLLRGNTYELLASALAAAGVASVRYDKRGVGKSASALASEQELRFETYIDDAAAWLCRLRTDRRFSKIAVAGHSEGALVGMIAAQRAPADAVVSLEGAGRPAPVILREQLKPKLPPALYTQADAIITRLQRGHTVAEVPPALASLFRPSVQPYLISWFRYDPAADIARVRAPVTIVQGTADVQVTLVDAAALARADPFARLIVIDGMNHVLKYAPDTSSQAAILKGYEDLSLPVDPRAVTAVISATR
jgi:pimeloyl-ACP methyl ester carboxylesterase